MKKFLQGEFLKRCPRTCKKKRIFLTMRWRQVLEIAQPGEDHPHTKDLSLPPVNTGQRALFFTCCRRRRTRSRGFSATSSSEAEALFGPITTSFTSRC